METRFFLLIALLCVLVIIQFSVAARFRREIAVLLDVQAFFWLLSFVGRSLYMWVFEPRMGEVLFDYRFASLGYRRFLVTLLPIAALGLAIYIVALLLLSRLRSLRVQETSSILQSPAQVRAALTALLFFAWIGRFGTEFSSESQFSYLWLFGNVAAFAAIVFWPDSRRSGLVVIAILVGEGLWTTVAATKTPFIAALVAVAVRIAKTHGLRRLARLTPLGVALLVVTFLIVQPLHGVDTADRATTLEGKNTFEAVASVLLQRADVLTPLGDAYLYPAPPWLDAAEYWHSVWTGLVPSGIHSVVGVRWTREVRTESFPNQYQDVFVAPGWIAEGLVQGGLLGVVTGGISVAVLTVAIGRLLACRSLPVALAAAVFAADTAVYEGGVLWILEGGSGAIQVFLMSWFVCLLIGGLERSSRRSAHRYPSAPHRQRNALTRPTRTV